MSAENKNMLIRGMDRFVRIFNPSPTAKEDSLETKAQAMPLGQFSNKELSPAFKTATKSDKRRDTGKDMRRYFEETSAASKDTMKELASLATMAPEIKRARDILVASIISPNDMQENSISITVDVPELETGKLQSDINKYLTDFFNNDLEFGVKLSSYIGECLYDSGSKALMIVPKYNIGTLSGAAELRDKAEVGLEHLMQHEKLSSTYSTDFSNACRELGKEKQSGIVGDCVADINNDPEFRYIKEADITKFAEVALESTVSKLGAKETEHKIISVSDNPSLVNIGDRKTDTALSELYDRVGKQFKKLHKDNLFVLSENLIGADGELPVVVELPTESVIPVTVPGYEKEHLGYFVLVDNHGNAISGKEQTTSKQLTAQAAKTFYGSNMSGDMDDKQRYHVASSVFNMTIKSLIESKLDEYGLTGLSISRYNAIAASMFDHFIKKNKVGLIFVPEPLMVYYRFEHRKNGTGKSLLEDASFLLALRTTTMVARVMAASKDAIDKKTVEVGISEQEKNPEALMDMVTNMFVEKRMPSFSNDPMAVAERLTRNALTIQPKGLDDYKEAFSVVTESKPSNTVQPDHALFEVLTDMVIDYLVVPHDALNHTKETEYSRSVATNSIFFSNTVRGYQRIVQKYNNKFARMYLTYAPAVQEKIKEIISSSTDMDKDSAKLKHNKIMQSLIKSISINLASPAVSTNKAQFEELSSFMDMIGRTVDSLLPDEFIDAENRDLKELMGTMRATVKSQSIRKFLDSVGFQGTINVPMLEDIDTDSIESAHQLMLNLQRMLKDQKAALAPDA